MSLLSTPGGNRGTGHFYLAKNRTFLLCVDTSGHTLQLWWHSQSWLCSFSCKSYLHSACKAHFHLTYILALGILASNPPPWSSHEDRSLYRYHQRPVGHPRKASPQVLHQKRDQGGLRRRGKPSHPTTAHCGIYPQPPRLPRQGLQGSRDSPRGAPPRAKTVKRPTL